MQYGCNPQSSFGDRLWKTVHVKVPRVGKRKSITPKAQDKKYFNLSDTYIEVPHIPKYCNLMLFSWT